MKEKKKSAEIFEKKQFVCSKCRYKFSVDLMRFSNAVCPWCGTPQQDV